MENGEKFVESFLALQFEGELAEGENITQRGTETKELFTQYINFK
jgi:hypothetical protein